MSWPKADSHSLVFHHKDNNHSLKCKDRYKGHQFLLSYGQTCIVLGTDYAETVRAYETCNCPDPKSVGNTFLSLVNEIILNGKRY